MTGQSGLVFKTLIKLDDSVFLNLGLFSDLVCIFGFHLNINILLGSVWYLSNENGYFVFIPISYGMEIVLIIPFVVF